MKTSVSSSFGTAVETVNDQIHPYNVITSVGSVNDDQLYAWNTGNQYDTSSQEIPLPGTFLKFKKLTQCSSSYSTKINYLNYTVKLFYIGLSTSNVLSQSIFATNHYDTTSETEMITTVGIPTEVIQYP